MDIYLLILIPLQELNLVEDDLRSFNNVLFETNVLSIIVSFFDSLKDPGAVGKQWRSSVLAHCKSCPVARPRPVCGSDGHIYSSQVMDIISFEYVIQVHIY